MKHLAIKVSITLIALTSSILAVNPVVLFETNKGEILIELFPDKAPESVKNFLEYVEEGFYNNTIFHRTIQGFVIQGGGFKPGLIQKRTRKPIKNEATNKLSNERGTVAMARTSVINSATSQFFINVQDNTHLNHTNKTSRGYGYAVFAKVLPSTMAVVDRISKVKVKQVGYYQNVPEEEIIVLDARVIQQKATTENATEEEATN